MLAARASHAYCAFRTPIEFRVGGRKRFKEREKQYASAASCAPMMVSTNPQLVSRRSRASHPQSIVCSERVARCSRCKI